ncbi:MAG: VOC family protein [Bacteroidota bacterium]
MEFNIYLFYNGNCEEAMNFYKEALGGKVEMMSRYGEAPVPCSEAYKNKIMHGVLVVDDFKLMFSDANEGHDVAIGTNYSVSLNFHSDEAIESAYYAISKGGKVTMPLQDTFWGAKFGMCTDKFGVNWMFNWDKPQE